MGNVCRSETINQPIIPQFEINLPTSKTRIVDKSQYTVNETEERKKKERFAKINHL